MLFYLKITSQCNYFETNRYFEYFLLFFSGLPICITRIHHSIMSFHIVSIFINFICYVNGDKLWKQVIVDESKILGNSEMILTTITQNRWHCGLLCDQITDCKTWCHNHEQTCLLTRILVSPLFSPLTSSTKTCFTNLERDYIVNSFVTFSPISSAYPSRTPYN